ncbi:MAG: hypothetical protein U9Q33_10380 [Campylobacterota bacterium]|nr:hypothetical protein [Campylobacterota bacterium]
MEKKIRLLVDISLLFCTFLFGYSLIRSDDDFIWGIFIIFGSFIMFIFEIIAYFVKNK